MVSLKDIAAACGVSVATVSKSLSDHKDISTATKEAVRQKARELGYLPNISARYLKTNRSYNIGVFFEDAAGSGLTHDFFAGVLQSFRKEAERSGYDVTFINTSAHGGMSYVERAKYRGLDGVAIACSDMEDENIQDLLKSDLKIVAVDYVPQKHTAVLSDNRDGIRQLVEYIIRQGHRKIAYITGETNSVTRIRRAAFLEACAEAGVEVPDAYLLEGKYRSTEKTAALTRTLLELPDRPTCILFPDDIAGFGGLNVIRGKGLRVPEDISVAGYDGIRVVQYLEPRLTTLAQDTDQLGKTAAGCLIEAIEAPERYRAGVRMVRGKLMEGQTVAKLQ